MKLLALIVITVLLYMGYRTLFHKQDSVERFEDGKELIFVFADWCGYCTRFKPTWNEIEDYSSKRNTFKTVALNADHEPNKPFLESYSVSSFPTLIVREGSRYAKYEGERTKDDILHFVEKF
jgi:thioredoxin domain-containing protein 10